MAENKPISLSQAEWSLMDYLWDHAPCTGRDAAKYCEEHIGWSRTTTLTILRHVVDKGAVACDESGTRNSYTPLIGREDAMIQETENFLDRMYRGSLSMMVSTFTRKKSLPKDEIEKLYAMLKELEGGNSDG